MEHEIDKTSLSEEEQMKLSNDQEHQDDTDQSSSEVVSLMDAMSQKMDANELPDKSDMERLSALIYRRPHQVMGEDDDEAESSDEEQDLEDRSDDDNVVMMRFLNIQSRFKEMRAKQQEAIRTQMEQNLEQKRDLLQRMSALLSSTEDFSKIQAEFRDIQDAWKAIGELPQQFKSDVMRDYQDLMSQFYELKSITNEFRDLDFAKNKEAKEHLIDLAQKLDEDPDVIHAFKQLQYLHDQWREIGPVAHEDREPMWKVFKEASTVINKKHQDFFTKRKEQEEENLTKKTALCEKIEATAQRMPGNRDEWRQFMTEVDAIKEEWKSIGFAPKKFNSSIYQRFRGVLNTIYAERSSFFKESKAMIGAKLDKYREILKEAEALKDSTDWKPTADKMIKLQEEWKAVGGLGTRVAEANRLWNAFTDACNTFFKNRQSNFNERNKIRLDNLEAKREIIKELEALKARPKEDDIRQELEDVRTKWQKIGHVPNKHKDEINDAYYGMVRELSRGTAEGNHRTPVDVEDLSADGLQDEYSRLSRICSRISDEIMQYENNLGFFSSNGSKENPLVKQVVRKIERLKQDLAGHEERLNEVKKQIRERRQKG